MKLPRAVTASSRTCGSASAFRPRRSSTAGRRPRVADARRARESASIDEGAVSARHDAAGAPAARRGLSARRALSRQTRACRAACPSQARAGRSAHACLRDAAARRRPATSGRAAVPTRRERPRPADRRPSAGRARTPSRNAATPACRAARPRPHPAAVASAPACDDLRDHTSDRLRGGRIADQARAPRRRFPARAATRRPAPAPADRVRVLSPISPSANAAICRTS